jgi:hypothetical protein
MLPITKKLQLLTTALVCCLVAPLLVNTLFAVLPPSLDLSKSLDFFFYNLFFKWDHFLQRNLEPAKGLVIIDSNESEMKHSRAEYAKMIEQLSQAQAACIGFDIFFTEKQDSVDDQKLVESVRKCSPQVVLAADFSPGKEASAAMMKMAEDRALPDSVCDNIFIVKTFGTGANLPFHDLLSVTEHIGHINSLQNEYHRFPPVIAFHRKCYASLPLQMAGLYFAARDSLFPLDKLSEFLDKDAQLLVNFIPVEKFKPYPYTWQEAQELLQEQPDVFKGAIVFIINPADEPRLQTPLGPYPRWALLASLTSQLVLNQHIDPTDDVFYPALFTTLFIFPGLTLFLFFGHRLSKKWRKTRFLFVSGNAVIFFLIFLTFRYFQVWLGVFAPLLAFNVSMGVMRARYYKLLKPPAYVDFGLAVLERQGKNYPIQVITSPAGEEEVNASFQAFFEAEDFQKKLEKLREMQASREDLRWMGDKLFESLFQNGIYDILKSSLDHVTDEKKHLRLSLRLDAPELAHLPWELIHSSRLVPSFLLLHKRLSLARYMPLRQAPRRLEFRVPLRILVVISSPTGLKPLNVKGEIKLIKKALRPLIWGGDVRVRFCENATLDNLRSELEREHGPEILHYIGHGHFDLQKSMAFLDLENANNKPDPVDAETFGNLLHESPVRLVVLNSCEGAVASDTDAFAGVAQNLMRAGVPAVVAMQYKILDRAAALFSKVFYATLITNYSIDAAVARARREIMTTTRTGPGQHSWATPVLFMRAQDGRIFALETRYD